MKSVGRCSRQTAIIDTTADNVFWTSSPSHRKLQEEPGNVARLFLQLAGKSWISLHRIHLCFYCGFLWDLTLRFPNVDLQFAFYSFHMYLTPFGDVGQQDAQAERHGQ